MRLKKYISPSITDAMKRIRSDMGPEAIILHSRKIRRGGLGGLFSRPWVEVAAAIDEKGTGAGIRPRSSRTAISGARKPDVDGRTNRLSPYSSNTRKDTVDISYRPPEPKRNRMKFPLSINQLLHEELVQNEVESGLARRILSKFKPEIGIEGMTAESAKKQFRSWIEDYIQVSQPKVGFGAKPHVIALVGPTGVGKTTTIAKLAANFFIVHNLNVALITIDTYRIGASEQLGVYAGLIKAPLELVASAEEFRQALARHNDKDVILVDTTGRSQYNWRGILELAGFFKGVGKVDVELVLSASTKYGDNVAAIDRFGQIGIDRLLFSKIDESCRFGMLLNLSLAKGLPISYLTTGQNVPDDIEPARKPVLAQLILEGREKQKVPAGIIS